MKGFEEDMAMYPCRLCNSVDQSALQHLPARSTGNDATAKKGVSLSVHIYNTLHHTECSINSRNE